MKMMLKGNEVDVHLEDYQGSVCLKVRGKNFDWWVIALHPDGHIERFSGCPKELFRRTQGGGYVLMRK